MQELQQRESQKRMVAYKVRISDILNNNLTKDGFSAGYIKLDGFVVSRVNILATLVYKAEDLSYASAIIDDGTGRISLRNFEKSDSFSKIDIGDVVLVIGKIREFNNEKYIIPEISKKLYNVGWINVRKLELKDRLTVNNAKAGKEEENNAGIYDEVYLLVKKLDNGEGVSVDDIIRTSSDMEVEKILNVLLENGDIFEVRPGRLKVLE